VPAADSPDAAGVAGRPVQGERLAPVVTDQHDSVQRHAVEPRLLLPGLILKPVSDLWLP
jgi:hypothetical protein